MKLQYISTIAAGAAVLSTSLVGFFPSNASTLSVTNSEIIVADNHLCPDGTEKPEDGECPTPEDN